MILSFSHFSDVVLTSPAFPCTVFFSPKPLERLFSGGGASVAASLPGLHEREVGQTVQGGWVGGWVFLDEVQTECVVLTFNSINR